MDDDRFQAPEQSGDAKLQLNLVTLAMFLLVAFQTVQLIRERANLAELWNQQEPTVQEGIRLRRQLDALAGGTARLAADGDANAAGVIDELRRIGITIRPQQGPGAAP